MATRKKAVKKKAPVKKKAAAKKAPVKTYNAESQKQRSDRYIDNQRERGLVQQKVWVPEADRERVKAYAAKLRKAALK